MIKIIPSLLYALILSLCICSLKSQNATVVGAAKSFQLQPADTIFVSGIGTVYTYYSTFNGTSGDFLIQPKINAPSGEVRPRQGFPGVFESGYAQATSSTALDYGSFTINLPTVDVDSDGNLDFLQLSRPVALTATGSGYSVVAKATFSISFALNRPANNAVGSYTATTQLTGQNPGPPISGKFVVLGYSGKLSYSRSANSNTMSLSVNSIVENINFSGTTTYTISSNGNTLIFPEFILTRASDSVKFTVKPGSLSRSGSTYKGSLSLADGISETTWVDFEEYWVSFTDTNDTDGDGIPNMTDELSTTPAITTHPTNQTATVGNSAGFSVTATGGNLTYQWRKDGTDISGATGATYTITSAATTSGASYAVAVTNSAGSVTSSAATLTVNAAPAPAPTPTSSSGGGGGGAVSPWFVGALGLLLLVRRTRKHV